MKPSRTLATVLIVSGLTLAVRGDEWKPAAGPLLTRWAADVSPENVHPEYPRPQMVRHEWLNLNGLWQLAVCQPDDAVPVGKELSEKILVPFPVESALSGVMRRADRLWYRRTFRIPDAWKGRRVLLHFQAVDWEATVFVNGKHVGTHRGGYDSFSLDITDAAKGTGQQELIVKVFDPTSGGEQPRGKQVNEPKGIWYTPSTGIWQTVWLEPVPETYVERLRIVPDVDGNSVRVTAEVSGRRQGYVVHAEVMLPAAAVGEPPEASGAWGPPGEELRISLAGKPETRLWSPDSPYLYDLKVALHKDGAENLPPGEIVDQVDSYFGMRKIDLAKDDEGFLRMRLNGQFLFQIGPLDQGFWPDGLYTAPTDEALRYDVEVTKKLGFNMARKHVKIEPARWYYWCDKLGLLVWQDMPSGTNKTAQSQGQFEQELRRMVEGFGNHPSIIVWVIFNEGWGQHDTERYVKLVKEMDPGRLVDSASGWTDTGAGDLHDIHKYPGPAAPDPEPQRASVLGEFGGLGLAINGHTWTEKSWGYRGTADSAELTARYIGLLRRVWGFQQSHGLSAAVYTQIADTETECNGLLTYDRDVIKVDVQKVAAANRGLVPKLQVVVPTSQGKGIRWRYTFEKPAPDWLAPGFDDSSWLEGPGGFGTKMTPGSTVRTVWEGDEIWIRRRFDLPRIDPGELALLVHHDEDVEIYVNGVLAAKKAGYTTDYEEVFLTAEGRRAFRPGEENVLAVHCRQTRGGQYIDVGVVRIAVDRR